MTALLPPESRNAEPLSGEPSVTNVGTAARPAFKRRPAIFVLLFVVYVVWVGAMVVWALKLRHG